MVDLTQNPNTRAAARFVGALADAGLRAVCIAPGSRSTPLVMAFAAEPRVTIYRHLDERSAGFFGLGLAKGSGRPVALLCTSGTAAANFHPAVVEARYARVPLLVLTADRPAELRESGANQTIDQIKMYGDHVLWAVDVALPADEAPAVVDRYLHSLAARAMALANGRPAGPVHLNFPFRKPLQPRPSEEVITRVEPVPGERRPMPRIVPGEVTADTEAYAELARLVAEEPRGIIVCGPESGRPDYAAQLHRLAETTGYPILADALSGLRRGPIGHTPYLMGGYDALMQSDPTALPAARLVLRFGAVPTSAALNRYLTGLTEASVVQINPDGTWADDSHTTDLMLQAETGRLSDQLVDVLQPRDPASFAGWLGHFQALEQMVWTAVAEAMERRPWSDAAAVWQLLSSAPDDGGVLMAGNSLPVRLLDQLTRPTGRPLWITGNRGASGIDGNVSAAFGLAASGHGPVTAVLGDVTFYHDMNGLMAGRLNPLPDVTFIVLNNDGGGIFRRLPIANHEPLTSDLFVMPHGLTFAQAATLYELAYEQVEPEALRSYLRRTAAEPSSVTIAEVVTGAQRDLEAQAHLAEVIRHHLAQLREQQAVGA